MVVKVVFLMAVITQIESMGVIGWEGVGWGMGWVVGAGGEP